MNPKHYYNLGYTVVPILPGSKAPVHTEWTSLDRDTLLGLFEPEHGIGIRGGDSGVIIIDVDINDPIIAQQVYEYMLLMFGTGVVKRIGQAPKFAVLVVCPELTSKHTGKKYTNGDLQSKIELLSTGQQAVISGIHPDTGVEYTLDGVLPSVSDLPYVTLDTLMNIVEYAEQLLIRSDQWQYIPKASVDRSNKHGLFNSLYDVNTLLLHYGWKHLGGNRYQRPGDDKKYGLSATVTGNTVYCFTSSSHLTEGENSRPWDIIRAYEFTDDQAMEQYEQDIILNHLTSAGFGQGIVVPAGTSELSPVDQVMEQFNTLEYNGTLLHPDQWFPILHGAELSPVDLDIVLDKIGDDGRFEGGKRVIKNEYKHRVNNLKVQQSESLLDYMQTRFVYMRNGNRIVDLEKPPHAALMKVSEFTLAFKKKGTVFLDGSDKPSLAVNAYFANDNYESVVDERFHPSMPIIYRDNDNLAWFNPAHFPTFEYTEDESRLDYIKEHYLYLFPGKEQWTRIMDWTAWTIHDPATRIKFTPLLVSKHHGTGRTWLTEMIPKQVGEHNCTITEMKILAGQGNEGTYQNYFYNSVFCAIQEVKVKGEEAFAVDDAIRSKLTDERMNLNLKYGTNGTYQVFVNFLLLTNHRDALVLTEDDRRIEVFEHFSKPKPDEFYDRIYKDLEDEETMRQLYWYFKRWFDSRQNDFNPLKPASMSEAKRRMIGTVTNDIGTAMKIAVEQHPVDIITTKILKDRVLDYLMDVAGMDISEANEVIEKGGKQLNMFCKKSFVQINDGKKVKVDGVSTKAYAIRNEDEWVKKSSKEIINEFKLYSIKGLET